MKDALARRAFVYGSVVLIGCEAFLLYLAFVRQIPTREIRGAHQIVISEFGDGTPVTQLFRMNAGGLRAISVLLASDRPAALRVVCELRQASDETPGPETQLHTWTQKFDHVANLDWHRLEFPPLRGSSQQTYWLRLRLLDARDAGARPSLESVTAPASRPPRVVIAASADNVREGGVLWIGNTRQVGSLFLRAHAGDETAYAQFRLRVVPKLPRPLRSRAVQAGLVIAYHWALLTYAYAVLVGGLGLAAPAASAPLPDAVG